MRSAAAISSSPGTRAYARGLLWMILMSAVFRPRHGIPQLFYRPVHNEAQQGRERCQEGGHHNAGPEDHSVPGRSDEGLRRAQGKINAKDAVQSLLSAVTRETFGLVCYRRVIG